MSETPETDGQEFIRVYEYGHFPPYPTVSSAFARDLERRLNAAIRERDNAESDRKQADADTIRALHERNEARKELEAVNEALGYDDAWSDGKRLSRAVAILRQQRDELREKYRMHHEEAERLTRWTSVNGVAELIAENEEQARLLGMSGEREAKLLAEIARLRSQVPDSQA